MINYYGDTARNRRAKLHLLLFLGQIQGDYISYVKEIAYFTWFALIRNASGGKRSTFFPLKWAFYREICIYGGREGVRIIF